MRTPTGMAHDRELPVMRHPADAALGGGREQRVGRRASVRRAVVPESSEAGAGTIHGDVVNMQGASVAQHEISWWGCVRLRGR